MGFAEERGKCSGDDGENIEWEGFGNGESLLLGLWFLLPVTKERKWKLVHEGRWAYSC